MLYKEVEIGGKVRPIKFGIQAIRLFENQCDVSVLDLIKNVSGNKVKLKFDHYIWLAYYGLKEGARKANIAFEFTDADVSDWFEQDTSVISEITTMFFESVGLIFTQKKIANQTSEKASK